MTWFELLLCSIAAYLAVWVVVVLCVAVSVQEDLTLCDRLCLLAWLPVIVWLAICWGLHWLGRFLEMIDSRRAR